jgi:hypothetical protein
MTLTILVSTAILSITTSPTEACSRKSMPWSQMASLSEQQRQTMYLQQIAQNTAEIAANTRVGLRSNLPAEFNQVPQLPSNLPPKFNQVPQLPSNLPGQFNQVPRQDSNLPPNFNLIPEGTRRDVDVTPTSRVFAYRRNDIRVYNLDGSRHE